MIKWFSIFFVLGPAMLFYSLGYWLKHPEEAWSGPLAVGLVGLIITVWTQKLGLKKSAQCKSPEEKAIWIGSQIVGLVAGVAIGVMIYFIT